jgi:hypothetical protein
MDEQPWGMTAKEAPLGMTFKNAETLNPIPICSECKRETRRITSRLGKGRYQCVNTECSNREWYIRGSKKDNELNRFGNTEEESEEIVKAVNESHKRDYDGSRRSYADQVSRTETVRNRAKAALAERNGHG